MDVIVNGILLGLLLSILIGPVFFSLLQTSIEKGFRAGVWMALGIMLSDALYISIAYLGISQLMEQDSFRIFLGMAGGVIMLIFGISSILKSPKIRSALEHENIKNNVFRLISKGFLLNGINPSVLIFWIGVVSMVGVNYDYGKNDALIFFSCIIATVFITDVFKAFLATKLRSILTVRFMNITNKVVGLALCVFSCKLFFYAFEAWMWNN